MMRKLKIDELNRLSISDFKEQEKVPIIVVLENIRSLNNVGTIFRTCDAYKVEAIYLVGITGKPPHREIQKSALGATESVTWKYFDDTQKAIEELKQNGYFVCAVEQAEGSVSITEIHEQEFNRLALIFGNEVSGVEQGTINVCDVCVELPQYGTKHSLNVAVCAGITIWESFKLLSR